MRVTNAEFYTRTRTLPLLRNRGNGTFEYFGRAADEIAADLFVAAGDLVLRSVKSGKEIFRLKDKADTTYEILVENEYLPEAHTESSSHFKYYYRLITKPPAQWYDFKVADDTVFSGNRHFNHAVIRSNFIAPGSTKTPCMMWGLGKRKDSLQ
jgi:Icc-related predicted phosphoesterase